MELGLRGLKKISRDAQQGHDWRGLLCVAEWTIKPRDAADRALEGAWVTNSQTSEVARTEKKRNSEEEGRLEDGMRQTKWPKVAKKAER
ncbi:hypothetical protein ERJ75_000491800 [Trypanosoma vivax]|nr:hypothetical protein ERJ75_000491800 [Trypanosoma vivax]